MTESPDNIEHTYVAFVRRLQDGLWGVRFPEFPDATEGFSPLLDTAKDTALNAVVGDIRRRFEHAKELPRARTILEFEEDDINFPELNKGTALNLVDIEVRFLPSDSLESQSSA